MSSSLSFLCGQTEEHSGKPQLVVTCPWSPPRLSIWIHQAREILEKYKEMQKIKAPCVVLMTSIDNLKHEIFIL